MPRFGVGVSDPLIAARPTADLLTRVSYLGAVASRVDSFWVPDHLNSLFPRSLWQPKYSLRAGLAANASFSKIVRGLKKLYPLVS